MNSFYILNLAIIISSCRVVAEDKLIFLQAVRKLGFTLISLRLPIGKFFYLFLDTAKRFGIGIKPVGQTLINLPDRMGLLLTILWIEMSFINHNGKKTD